MTLRLYLAITFCLLFISELWDKKVVITFLIFYCPLLETSFQSFLSCTFPSFLYFVWDALTLDLSPTRPSSSAASRSDGCDGAGQRCTSFHCTCRYLWGDAPVERGTRMILQVSEWFRGFLAFMSSPGVRSRRREPGVCDSGVWPPAGPSRSPPCYRWDWSSHEPESRSPQLHTDDQHFIFILSQFNWMIIHS